MEPPATALTLGLAFVLISTHSCNGQQAYLPVVIGTWGFRSAAEKAWSVLYHGGNRTTAALDAVEAGCGQCETEQCDGTVGFGGSPDENGETRLDAMIMDGDTGNVGAVGSMGRIKSAAAVARHVLDHTKHTLLVGDLATEFAKQMGFQEESLSTEDSQEKWKRWKSNSCQPNFWTNVSPDPSRSCGPYTPMKLLDRIASGGSENGFGMAGNHDTIGMVAIDGNGKVAAGTSTNGASHKIPGRVGDSPVPGSGAFADSDVGGAAATGDGDVMMRFLPSFLSVELMRHGLTPRQATRTAIERIVAKNPDFTGAVIAVNKRGRVGAACHGLGGEPFPFTLANRLTGKVVLLKTECIDSMKK